MKGAGKFLISLIGVTLLVLLYVHIQVSLFQVSYSMNTQSHQLADKSEAYRLLKFEVDQLRAPRLLEQKMKDMQIELALPKEVQVVKIPAAPAFNPESLPNVSLKPLSDGLLDFLGRWVKIAQAKTDA
ncbi:MAG: hypothetical protein HYZ83_02780 [Candidatus Omnitrophica bacterium]|nr:hypothetical protein [Candidatus Omnitrophota bacterium]